MKSRTKTTPYNLAELFNNAHVRVATITISDCKSTRIYTINSNIFTDDDFITTDRIYEIAERIVVIEDNEFRTEEVGNCISPSLKEWNMLSRSQIRNCPTNIN